MNRFVYFLQYTLYASFIKPILYKSISRKKHFITEEAIIIVSDARGGSTWLMEMLQKIPNTITNWEPLQVNLGVVPKSYHFGWNPYIPKEDTTQKYIELFRNILNLKLINSWTIRYSSLAEVKNGTQVITKTVRAQLLLPWLTKQFNFKHKPIQLLRHPIAVALSQEKAFFKDRDLSQNFKVPEVINNERYIKYKEVMEQAENMLQRQVAEWCLNNHYSLLYEPKDWLVVYYEDLVMQPEKELVRINKECQLSIPIDSIDFTESSKTDFNNELQEDKNAQLSKWQKKVSAHDLQKIQQIFDTFEISIYNTQSIFPIKK